MPLNVDSLNAGTISQNGEPVKPYKVYTALFSQSSGNNPEVIILENTLGGEINWVYNSDGSFTGNLINGFVPYKTFIIPIMFGDDWTAPYHAYGVCGSVDFIDLYVWDAPGEYNPSKIGDPNGFFRCPIEIRVYN